MSAEITIIGVVFDISLKSGKNGSEDDGTVSFLCLLSYKFSYFR